MALLDPVCLMTCAPGLLANFVYKLPEVSWRNAASAEGMMDAARAVASRDLLIAASFCRKCVSSMSFIHLSPLIVPDVARFLRHLALTLLQPAGLATVVSVCQLHSKGSMVHGMFGEGFSGLRVCITPSAGLALGE